MYSSLVFRTMTPMARSLMKNRFLSLTRTQFTAAAKLKETTRTDDQATGKKASNEKIDEKLNANKSIEHSEPNKIYSEKIRRLVDEISKLSLVDVMDLNELLKKTLKIQDVPIVASGGATAVAPPAATKKEEEEEEARPSAQSVFKVRLIKFDETKKVPVIKQVKDAVENINLVQAKKLVESVPQVLRDNMSKADAEALKAKVEAAGGVCVIE